MPRYTVRLPIRGDDAAESFALACEHDSPVALKVRPRSSPKLNLPPFGDCIVATVDGAVVTLASRPVEQVLRHGATVEGALRSLEAHGWRRQPG